MDEHKAKKLCQYFLLYVCGETESPADRNKAKHTKDRTGETGSVTNRQKDKQRKTGRAKDTQQADGEAWRPPGSPVMKTVGNTTEGVHVMF